MNVKHFFKMKRPCADCPFLKGGGIPLEDGRIEQIKRDLMEDDERPFQCHKTTYSTGGTYDEDTEKYLPSGKEVYCAGSMVFLYANRRMNVPMRLGLIYGALDIADLEATVPLIDTSV
ncbi:hypothetical protein ACQFG6_006100 [Klebsiella michiganensis]|uniref:hypothetical protein n=1 Tax=Klebsiella michiganensis TaxID=1134687 RepID=UPI000983852B|nr:hypothetical protein [Klebsiella michiganensis]MBM7228382.1 hypothetical protein [Klebsiella michiganensis]